MVSGGVVKKQDTSIEILQLFHTPCVIKFHEAIMCADATYFVIEHAEGGELFDFVLEDFQNDTSSESVAKGPILSNS